MRYKLRFPPSALLQWAHAYGDAMDDDMPTLVGRRARKVGHLDRYEFLEIARWKSPRTQPRCAENSEAFVRDVTTIALSTANEQLAIEVLTLLRGVSWPTASVILHFCSARRYPILDFRALWTLSIVAAPTAYDFALWSGYVDITRSLAARLRCDMRTLDRALWAYSKAHQPSSS